jgi:uncharacterized protein YndB with AHSA1/START domain
MLQEKENVDTLSSTADRELTISRILNAPVELVWEVFTKPEHIKRWWGPNGFTNTIFQMDVKPGGAWDFVMHGPDGTDYKNKSVYKEIVEHRKIVYEHITGPSFVATIEFEEQDGKTLLNWRMLFESKEEFTRTVKTFKADEGLKQNIYKLEGYVLKVGAVKELTITRLLNAPREIVFKAWTDVEQLRKWWGPKDFTNRIVDFNSQPGGRLDIDMIAPDGIVYPMTGEWSEIVEPGKIVFISAAVDANGKKLFEVLTTVTFEEENGKTRLTLHAAVSHLTEEGKPYVDGMNKGWNESLDRLTNLVQS